VQFQKPLLDHLVMAVVAGIQHLKLLRHGQRSQLFGGLEHIRRGGKDDGIGRQQIDRHAEYIEPGVFGLAVIEPLLAQPPEDECLNLSHAV
jgi:hypothetical protein